MYFSSGYGSLVGLLLLCLSDILFWLAFRLRFCARAPRARCARAWQHIFTTYTHTFPSPAYHDAHPPPPARPPPRPLASPTPTTRHCMLPLHTCVYRYTACNHMQHTTFSIMIDITTSLPDVWRHAFGTCFGKGWTDLPLLYTMVDTQRTFCRHLYHTQTPTSCLYYCTKHLSYTFLPFYTAFMP